jgi:hypothetical protein
MKSCVSKWTTPLWVARPTKNSCFHALSWDNHLRCQLQVWSIFQKVIFGYVTSGIFAVHKLRPSDIEVVAALGDSLTAANGGKALTVVGVLTEYRGMSWSIGGDADLRTVTTLPNILKLYNKNLRGFSLGHGKYTDDGANFNVAQPGHKSQYVEFQSIYRLEILIFSK